MNPPPPAILLIEKDEVTLELYQRELGKCFTVFAFTEISGILDVLVQQDIQAIVIEPEACEGQGWELIDSIMATVPGQGVPIIICSTRDANQTATVQKAAAYLTKPVLPKTLREKTLDIIAARATQKKSS